MRGRLSGVSPLRLEVVGHQRVGQHSGVQVSHSGRGRKVAQKAGWLTVILEEVEGHRDAHPRRALGGQGGCDLRLLRLQPRPLSRLERLLAKF